MKRLILAATMTITFSLTPEILVVPYMQLRSVWA